MLAATVKALCSSPVSPHISRQCHCENLKYEKKAFECITSLKHMDVKHQMHVLANLFILIRDLQ